jgi:membrane glycosyltransferase
MSDALSQAKHRLAIGLDREPPFLNLSLQINGSSKVFFRNRSEEAKSKSRNEPH